MEPSGLENKALPLTAGNLVKAVGDSLVGGPLPRIGTVVSTFVKVPHLLKPATEEDVSFDPTIALTDRVIVYTTADDAE